MKRQPTEHEVTVITADGTRLGVVEENTIRLVDGDDFCPRCGLALSQCICKSRKV